VIERGARAGDAVGGMARRRAAPSRRVMAGGQPSMERAHQPGWFRARCRRKPLHQRSTALRWGGLFAPGAVSCALRFVDNGTLRRRDATLAPSFSHITGLVSVLTRPLAAGAGWCPEQLKPPPSWPPCARRRIHRDCGGRPRCTSCRPADRGEDVRVPAVARVVERAMNGMVGMAPGISRPPAPAGPPWRCSARLHQELGQSW